MRQFEAAGFVPLDGYQLRYIYFIDPTYRARLTVPEIPFSEIERVGAQMYKGQRVHAEEETSVSTGDQPEQGGATPTPPLHSFDALTL